MIWETIFTTQRIGQSEEPAGARSGFQRDFDRIIFSSAFRRLQNKTQVFPLPGSTFVHNRLTHSLEVASVGRSLGSIVGEKISKELKDRTSDSFDFYRYELANVIAAACLAHDIGNPAFGHSGEKAISAYFTNNASIKIEGKDLQSFFNGKEWTDITNFEGNANAIRILTHNFKGRLIAGLGLTYTTIASIIKYPCEATATDTNFKHRKKFGFFQSEASTVKTIAERLGMIKEASDELVYKRHPFVYLVEAADDICYSIMDLEDAHRLAILSHEYVANSLMHVISTLIENQTKADKIYGVYKRIDDLNEKISYLRAKSIDLLINKSAEIFFENRQLILKGNFNNTLIDYIDDRYHSMDEVRKVSFDKIYNHDTVLEIEIAGYNVMSELLSLFVPALLKEKRDHKDVKLLKLFPLQFREFENTKVPYNKILNVFDLISGMTDLYATELYRKLKGFDIPQHR